MNDDAAKDAEIARLREALQEMVQTQAEWEECVSKIIGRPIAVFERAIDRARAALAGEDGK